MSSYIAPLLPLAEINQYMKENYGQIGFAENDMSHPERRNWQKFYTAMLCDSCMNLIPESLNQMPMNSELSTPEIHEEAIPLINLHRSMQKLLEACGFMDFTISDIIGPIRPKRLIRLCSSFINFRRFQEQCLMKYDDLKAENDALQDQREALLQENEDMKQSINNIKGQQAEKDVEVEAIQERMSEWHQKIDILHQEVNNKQKGYSEGKVKIAEINSSLAQMKEQLVQAKQENSRLTAKIVPSPDRLQGEKERMERQLVQAKHSQEGLEKRQRECIQRFQLQQQRDQAADLALRCLDAIQEPIQKQKSVLTAINNNQEETGNKRTEIKVLDGKAQQLTLQINTKQEKMEKVAMLHNVKMNEMKLSLEQLEKELSSMQQVCGEQHHQSQRLRADIQAVKDQQRQEFTAYKATMSEMHDKYREMLKHLDSYHVRLGESYQNLVQSMSPEK